MAKKGSARSRLYAWSVLQKNWVGHLNTILPRGGGFSKVQMPGKGILNFELIDALKTVNKDLPSLID